MKHEPPPAKLHGEMKCTWRRILLVLSCFVAGFSQTVESLAIEVASPHAAPNSGSAAIELQEAVPHTAAWPFFNRRRRPIYDSGAGPVTPHPAVARIIVPESGATAYGSGTLVDVRDQYGLVVTNWHVVRDSQGVVEVTFPSGFRSQARPLKVDSEWDLAALVIWRPPIEPVRLAPHAPRPGDLLTIHGYGQGQYRIATGRCTNYYAPRLHFPQEMVELDVEARQGDSGGPIFNQEGELAGVLFGAGEGTTLGSFGPRVGTFLATLAPDIGLAQDQAQIAVADRPAPLVHPRAETLGGQVALSRSAVSNASRNATCDCNGCCPVDGKCSYPNSPWSPSGPSAVPGQSKNLTGEAQLASASMASDKIAHTALAWQDIAGSRWYEPVKSLLAVVGLAAIALHFVKLVR